MQSQVYMEIYFFHPAGCLVRCWDIIASACLLGIYFSLVFPLLQHNYLFKKNCEMTIVHLKIRRSWVLISTIMKFCCTSIPIYIVSRRKTNSMLRC